MEVIKKKIKQKNKLNILEKYVRNLNIILILIKVLFIREEVQ